MAQYAAATINSFADGLNIVTRASVEEDKIIDQVFDTSPLFAIMKTQKHLKMLRGGLFRQKNLNVGRSPNAGWYTGSGSWRLAKFEGLIAAGWDWKLAHDAILILGEELLRNWESDEAIANLVQERVDVASLTLPDIVAADFYTNNPYGTRSDGTPGNPASIEGLAVLVDDGTISNTIGQVSRTTYPSLKSKVNYNAALGGSLIPNLEQINIATSRGQTSRVNIHLTGELAYGGYWGLLQPTERYTLTPQRLEAMGIKTTGGNDLAFNDAPVLIDEKCPTGVYKPGTTSGTTGGFWYQLNLDWFEFFAHEDRFFTLGEWQKDASGDQYFMDIFLACGLLCERPNKQGALWIANA